MIKHLWFSLLFWQSLFWKINGILSMEWSQSLESFVDMCMIRYSWWVFSFEVIDSLIIIIILESLNSLVFYSSHVSIYSLRKQERILHCLLFSLLFSYSHLLLLWVLVLLDHIVLILYHWLLVTGFWWYCQVCVYLLNRWEWSDELNWRYSQWRDFNWDWLDLWWLVCLWMNY